MDTDRTQRLEARRVAKARGEAVDKALDLLFKSEVHADMAKVLRAAAETSFVAAFVESDLHTF